MLLGFGDIDMSEEDIPSLSESGIELVPYAYLSA